MAGTAVYFASDVHLGLKVGDYAAREASFVKFLHDASADAKAVYLLGDIWDFWYEYKYVVPKGYARVFAAIQDLVDAGVEVAFLPGNHDIWAYSYFEELGMKKLRQPALVDVGGKVFCVGHGDGLGPVPLGYRILRGIFHSRFLQFLFSSLIHPTIAFALGYGWSESNRKKHLKRGPYQFKDDKEPLYKFACEYSEKNKVDCFVFGHYHAGIDCTLPSGVRLIVLKDWIDGPSFLRIPLE